MARRKSPSAAARELNGAEIDAGDKGGSRSVRRVLSMFEFMLERGEPVSMAEMIDGLGIPKSSAYELIRTLAQADYVETSAKNGGLILGRKLFQLGMAYRNQVDLMKDGARIVEELRDQTGETVQFSVLLDDHMHVLMKEEGLRPIRIVSNVGSRVPVNWAAAGRLLVSDLDDAALRRLLAATIRQSPSGRACMDIDEIMASVRAFRRAGYGSEVNEVNEHAGCVAAPVIDANGRCIAAISIVAPEQRLTGADRGALISAATDAAGRLSRRLGGE
ncbi:IclR family transcriptional regulator [Pikeienuella piscinae]|uniref:IclR family transcriptional regulator n=1 Tax=Pikeienuella piscinae TaxID=2748098 RepID=A0A7L5BWK0_9RHOB|nr:IclR family transcriptional regulator [Pikeienuella piscinae]QIE54616.1 IclR family transcriptional regulator [Pikeienuella piscinae]